MSADFGNTNTCSDISSKKLVNNKLTQTVAIKDIGEHEEQTNICIQHDVSGHGRADETSFEKKCLHEDNVIKVNRIRNENCGTVSKKKNQFITYISDGDKDSVKNYANCPSDKEYHGNSRSSHNTSDEHKSGQNLTCALCGDKCVSEKELIKHSACHNSTDPLYKCVTSQCHFTTKYLTCLKRHTLIHTGLKPYSCDVCGRQFSQLSNLKTHMLVHNDSKPFQCEICGVGFRQKVNLLSHFYTHKNQAAHEDRNEDVKAKKYSCDLCAKQFRFKGDVKRHKMTIHQGIMAYKCDKCDRQFKQSSHLKRHLLCHSGVKPFPCTVCDKRFSTNFQMQSHMLIHEKS